MTQHQQSRVALVLDENYSSLVCGEILHARNSIDMVMYLCTLDVNLPPDSKPRLIIRALACAAERGVTVRVLLGNPENRKLAHLNRISGAFMQKKGVETRMSEDNLQHAKLIVIDNAFSILGSHNITNRGLSDNSELSIAIWSSDSAKMLSNQFLQYWQQAG